MGDFQTGGRHEQKDGNWEPGVLALEGAGGGRDGHVLIWIGEHLLGHRGGGWWGSGAGAGDPTMNFLSCSAQGVQVIQQFNIFLND